MSIAAGTVPRARQAADQPWLRSARWDLTFLILSIVLAFIPYSVFLIFGTSGSFDTKGTAAYNARIFINNLVAIFIGGPHMYATFTRTIMDPVYLRRRLPIIASTILVPVAVILLSVLSYQTYVWLLTIFFAMASLHALYQIIWLSDAYNTKAKQALSLRSRLIDYGLVLSSLYPIATFKMVEGTFKIGPVSLKYHDVIALLPRYHGDLGRLALGPVNLDLNKILGGQYYLSTLAFIAFFVLLVLWIGKTVSEYRSGTLNAPKTILISLTAMLMFWTPLATNMDTAFQGVNTWHSFQYLALTWYANRLREQKTRERVAFMHWPEPPKARRRGRHTPAPSLWQRGREAVLSVLRRLDRGSGWTTFYLVCMLMLPISGLLIWGGQRIWPDLGSRGPGADEVYSYMGILSVLLVHYVQDALLFTDPKSIVE